MTETAAITIQLDTANPVGTITVTEVTRDEAERVLRAFETPTTPWVRLNTASGKIVSVPVEKVLSVYRTPFRVVPSGREAVEGVGAAT